MATGKTRSEFSGAGADQWYARFLPAIGGFISPSLFASNTTVWPTNAADPVPTLPSGPPAGNPPPGKPLHKIPTNEFQGLWLTPSADGMLLAGAWHRGAVNVYAFKGAAPKLRAVGSPSMATALAFSRSGNHLIAVVDGVPPRLALAHVQLTLADVRDCCLAPNRPGSLRPLDGRPEPTGAGCDDVPDGTLQP